MQRVLLFGQLFRIESVTEIKNASENLDNKFDEALSIANQKYPEEKGRLESANRNLIQTKERYENKTRFMDEDISLSTTQIEMYKIEFLWTIIGNYATKEKITLTLDLRQTQNENVYDLDFNLSGGYIGITNFLYSIENDERLNFKIDNFMISPGGVRPQNTPAASSTGLDGLRTESTSNQAANQIEQNTQANNTEPVASQGGDTSALTATFTVVEVGITLDD